MQKIIAHGAEAILYRRKFEGNYILIKERIKKSYRITEIDKALRKTRTKNEAKLLNEARRRGVATPQVFSVKEYKIAMEFIDGKRIKEILLSETDSRKEIAEKIGSNIAKLHSGEIVHGDLTTSNMILKGGKIIFIDFGLGFFSKKTEDYATDLSVLKEAIKSTHFKYLNELWQTIINSYTKEFDKGKDVLKKLEEIEKRGRYVKNRN